MRKRVVRVFGSAVDTTGVYSDRDTHALLGAYDKLGMMVVVDELVQTQPATLSLFIDHSSDGHNWLAARLPAQLPLHTTADLQVTLSFYDQQAATYVDPMKGVSRATGTAVAKGPLLHFVRLFLIMSAGLAHVRVHAFQRDS